MNSLFDYELSPVDPALERAITALMTCAPIDCAHESECFRIARFARDQVRAAYAQVPGVAVPALEDDEIAIQGRI